MNEIEQESITVERKRNPKVVLGFFSIIILLAAIVLVIDENICWPAFLGKPF